MLNEVKQQTLRERVAGWSTENNVPKQTADMVLTLAISDPKSLEDAESYCDSQLWSRRVVEHYSDFLAYLRAKNQPSGDKGADVKSRLLSIIQQLQGIAEAL